MKSRSLLLALVLALGISATGLANETTTVDFYNRGGVVFLVTGDYVRVRTHPSTDGYIICELRKGSLVRPIAGGSDDTRYDYEGRKWYYVVMEDGSVGWVCGDFLQMRC